MITIEEMIKIFLFGIPEFIPFRVVKLIPDVNLSSK